MKRIIIFLSICGLLVSCTEVLQTMATSSSVNYTHVTVTAVRLEEFSAKAPNGSSWDPMGGKPDIYCTLKEGSIVSRKSTFPNVFVGTPLTWRLNQPFIIQNMYSILVVAFYDEEEGLNVGVDDYMGSVVFSPLQYKTGLNRYPATVTLTSASSPAVKVTLELSWS